MPRPEPLAPAPRDPREALDPYRPDRGHGPWDVRLTAHLLRRALCGGGPGRARALVAVGEQFGAQEAVQRVFPKEDAQRTEAWRRAGRSLAEGGREALAAWWLMKLAHAERATESRLTLFWHDHFACGQGKVADLPMTFRQHRTLEEHGDGAFHALLHAMARDPAMLVFLDGDSNRRGLPNENLAREILELFALGVGHYTEEDIREAARALTGRTVRRGAYHFEERHHDPDPKRVLGATVHDGDDLVRVIVAQDACPRFLARKLWRWYVSPEPREEVIDLLAERWRAQDLNVAWLVRTLLASRAFFSSEAVGSLVKSPVEYVVGVARALDARPDFRVVERAAAAMGQSLFEPPGVQGWEGGEAWIHTAAWIERSNFAARVAAGEETLVADAPLDALFPPARRGDAQTALEDLESVFLPGGIPPERRTALLAALRPEEASAEASPAGAAVFRAAAHAVLCLPAYHLG